MLINVCKSFAIICTVYDTLFLWVESTFCGFANIAHEQIETCWNTLILHTNFALKHNRVVFYCDYFICALSCLVSFPNHTHTHARTTINSFLIFSAIQQQREKRNIWRKKNCLTYKVIATVINGDDSEKPKMNLFLWRNLIAIIWYRPSCKSYFEK